MSNQFVNAPTPAFQHPHRPDQIYNEDALKAWGKDAPEIIALLDDNQRALEDSLISPEVPASFPGIITPKISTPWHLRRGQRLIEFRALLGSPPGNPASSCVISVQKNGITLKSLTFVNLDTVQFTYMNELWQPDSDLLTFSVDSTMGTAADLTCIARYI